MPVALPLASRWICPLCGSGVEAVDRFYERISHPALTDIEILEVSTPDLDDVVRLEDRYGRAGTTAP